LDHRLRSLTNWKKVSRKGKEGNRWYRKREGKERIGYGKRKRREWEERKGEKRREEERRGIRRADIHCHKGRERRDAS
jgi:hypothetical protein